MLNPSKSTIAELNTLIREMKLPLRIRHAKYDVYERGLLVERGAIDCVFVFTLLENAQGHAHFFTLFMSDNREYINPRCASEFNKLLETLA